MSKLLCTVSETSNYIYHMLSVGMVGYNNDYGQEYKSTHSENDLKILKEHEMLLTVNGGEHCGDLYVLLIAKPAAAKNIEAMIHYFQAMIDLFNSKEIENTSKNYAMLDQELIDSNFEGIYAMFEFCLNSFDHYSTQIVEIADILIRNIDLYLKGAWISEKEKLFNYKKELEMKLDTKGDIIEKWQSRIGIKYKKKQFEVVLCNSLENGAQAININETKDVFSSTNSIDVLIKWISHEIGIYLIFQLLPQYVKDNLLKYWEPIESIATYHNSFILDQDKTHWSDDNPYLSTIEKQYKMDPMLSIEDLIENTFV